MTLDRCSIALEGMARRPERRKEEVLTATEFKELREIGYNMGFDYVESGPLVRSSYHSEKHVIAGWGRNKWLEEKNMI